MGLLLGASALTLCEVLDLIIYNMVLKMADGRHRFRSVTDVKSDGEKQKAKKTMKNKTQLQNRIK